MSNSLGTQASRYQVKILQSLYAENYRRHIKDHLKMDCMN